MLRKAWQREVFLNNVRFYVDQDFPPLSLRNVVGKVCQCKQGSERKEKEVPDSSCSEIPGLLRGWYAAASDSGRGLFMCVLCVLPVDGTCAAAGHVEEGAGAGAGLQDGLDAPQQVVGLQQQQHLPGHSVQQITDLREIQCCVRTNFNSQKIFH